MEVSATTIVRHHAKQRLRLLIALALIGTLLAGLVFRDHEREIASETERLRALARVADENLGRQLEALSSSMTGVSKDLPFFAGERFQESMSRRLSALSTALPGVRTLLLVDGAGNVLASNREEAIGQNVSRRAYFQQLKEQSDPMTMYLSEPFTTTSQVFSLNAIKPMVDSRGRFSGLIAATLDPEHFGVLLRSLLYAPDMRATLVHGDGKVFMSIPINRASQGMNLAVEGSNFTLHRNTGAAESVTTASTYSLGERRLTAWRNIQPASANLDKPLVLAIGRQLDAALAPWRQTALFYAVIYLLLSGMALLTLHLVQRRHRQSMEGGLARDEAARKSAERVDLALAGASLGLWDVDLESGRTAVNARYQEILGFRDDPSFSTLEELFAKIHPEDVEAVEEAFAQAQQSAEGEFNMELRMRHADGHWVWIHSIGKITERDVRGRARRATGTHLDISDRKATEAQIWDMAFYDPLTRLPNRRLLVDRIALARNASERSGRMAALMFVDLDRFKALNDTHGHAAGDELLRQVATRLTSCVRQSDTVSRLGGDEFVLLLQNLDAEPDSARAQAQAVAYKALHALQAPFELQHARHALSASIGVALFMGRDASVDNILEQADQAMYRAKRAGRNVVEICEIPRLSI